MKFEIGKALPGLYPIYTSEKMSNDHILITGRSGSGKTMALYKVERSIVRKGGQVLVLNYNMTHSVFCDSEIRHYSVKDEGFPFSLLTPIRYPDGKEEQAEDIAESLVNVFASVSRMGAKQKMAFRKAVLLAIEDRTDGADELQLLGKTLSSIENMASTSVYSDFWYLFGRIKTSYKVVGMDSGKILSLDFTGYSSEVQRILTELVLALIWRYYRIWGQDQKKPLYVVCDEFQTLNLNSRGTFQQIMREGRKFNLSLLLATQTLDTVDKGTRTVIQQAATRLLFRPADGEVKSLAKSIALGEAKEMETLLMNLQVGECVAVGDLSVNNRSIRRPLKISFYETMCASV
jgi:type IV secretory pathway VirB4 component